jgi:Domain of unknown function (DUF5668)
VLYSRHPNRHFIVGVIILLVGVVLLLDQIGFVAANDIFKFWPLILIYFGVNRLKRRPGAVGWFWGGFLVLLGISFQLQELGLSHVHIFVIWPVFLICVGVLLILQRYESRSRWENPPPQGPLPDYPAGPPPVPPVPPSVPPAGSSAGPPPGPESTPASTSWPGNAPQAGAPSWTQSNFAQGDGPAPGWRSGKSWDDFHQRMDDFRDRMHNEWDRSGNSSQTSAPRLNEVNIFWGGKRCVVAKNFVGGEIVSIFGGFDVDLREADLLGDIAEIEVVTIFGGGDIRVPPNWEIVMDTVGIFGGCGDRTRHPDPPIAGGSTVPPVKKLIIKGVAIFGGLNVKN